MIFTSPTLTLKDKFWKNLFLKNLEGKLDNLGSRPFSIFTSYGHPENFHIGVYQVLSISVSKTGKVRINHLIVSIILKYK